MTPEPTRPLAAWRFDGVLRHYQADVLARVDTEEDRALHIVAPPGSGKTLLGLLLAARHGRRTVVLAPTTTIRRQWAEAATSLAPDPAVVSEDPLAPGELTALTYQALSVLDDASPLEQLAAARWRDELEATGRSADGAREWLDDLARSNRRAYRAGIARRSRAIRRTLAREDATALQAALHPNARALVDRLVAAEVETVILDECHHLLDHWAMVVAALLARLRQAGRHPLVIGLTATLPSPDDADEYDNYTSLLGEVDYEVPTPAVVREGNLAPYRALVRFVEPTTDELGFLRAAGDGLAALLRATFARDDGLVFLVDHLQPALPDPPANDPLTPPPPTRTEAEQRDTRLQLAFAADYSGSEAMAAMLSTVCPDHPLVAALPDAAHRPPSAEESLRILSRYTLDRVLPDPARRPQWDRIRRALADFGYTLTDRGVRRSRDPVDTMLASSIAKDHGTCDVLRLERDALGDRLRALVVTDFARHGNRHGGLIAAAGALRTFDVIATDGGTRTLPSLLVTGSTVQVPTAHADAVVAALRDELGLAVAAAPLQERPLIAQVHAPGAGTAAIVTAVAALLTRGVVRVVVGTRGLFGEGWDCPAVNTLVDLTAVATASATQQLRGRTLRLDPRWPEKVAHNWTVTAVLPPDFPLNADPDLSRLRRKHLRLWGLDRDDPTRVARGLNIALTAPVRAALRAGASAADVTALIATDLTPRETTYAQWRVGDEYLDREQVSALVLRAARAPVFRTSAPQARALSTATGLFGAVAAAGATFAAAAPVMLGPADVAVGVGGASVAVLSAIAVLRLARPTARARRQTTRRCDAFRDVATLVWDSLQAAGRVATTAAPIVVTERHVGDGDVEWSVSCPDATPADQRTLASALAELFGPTRTPRFLLQLGPVPTPGLAGAVLRTSRSHVSEYLPVPTQLGRRRADAEAFAAEWSRRIGGCLLHRLDTPDAMAIAARARRETDTVVPPRLFDQWV